MGDTSRGGRGGARRKTSSGARSGGRRLDTGRARQRAGGFFRARSGKQKLGGVAAVLLLVTAPFGGLHAEATPAPAELELGSPIDIGPLEVTVKKVVTVADLAPSVKPAVAGDRLFVIEVLVKNDTDVPQGSLQLGDAFYGKGTGVVALPGAKQPSAQTFVVSDGSKVDDEFNPGITYEVAVVFEQTADWKQQPVRLGLNGYRFQAVDPQSLDPDRWILDAPIAEGTVPVEVKK